MLWNYYFKRGVGWCCGAVFEHPNWLLHLMLELTCTNTWFYPYAPPPVNVVVRPQNYRCQNRKEYKGKMNWAQSALVLLLWLLYWPCSTNRPHMYPTWGMGVVGGCTRAVLAKPPSPLTPLLHNLHCGNPTLRKRWCRHHTFLFCHL